MKLVKPQANKLDISWRPLRPCLNRVFLAWNYYYAIYHGYLINNKLLLKSLFTYHSSNAWIYSVQLF